MRVLIADDDPGIRGGIAAQIKADGFEAVPCGNGAEALQWLTGGDAPPIALVDWVLPDCSGVDVCRMVRGAGNQSVPYIIMLTVKREPRDVAEALDAGANDYVTKPFSMMELRARIRVARRVAELQQALQRQVNRAETARREVSQLTGLIPVCSRCRQVRDDADYWQELERYFSAHADTRVTRGVCPTCSAKLEENGGDVRDGERKNP
jgi:DNA-binding response OmpR family regulator